MTPFTVIMPALNAADTLGNALAALSRSGRKPAEVIVIDDGSTDATPRLAADAGATVLHTEHGPRGGSVARNLGARHADTPLLVFVDADVSVHPETLGLLLQPFDDHPAVAATFGSYDADPSHPSLVSRYRNLLHHHTHQHANREAWTFWSGLGAVRADAFAALGGFDEAMAGVSVEDIELGLRLRRAGHRIALVPETQATHHKRWTLRGMVKTDIWQRAVPWTRLLRRMGDVPADMNVDRKSRVSAVLAGLLVMGLSAILIGGVEALLPPVPRWVVVTSVVLGLAVALPCIVALIILHRRFYAVLRRAGGLPQLLVGVPLHWLYFLYSAATFVAVNVHDRLNSQDATRPRIKPPGTRSVPAIAPHTARDDGAFPFLLTAAYALVLAVGLYHHEVWRDEAQAWLLARFADSPAGVIRNIAAEGHPGLWHLILWAASRFVAAVWIMQAIHWIIAVAGAALIAFASPFTRVQRVLLCFGYYSLFEYGMISRGYTLGIALVFAAVALAGRPRRRFWMIGLLLGLAANTSVYGCMIAGAVMLGLLIDTALARYAARPPKRQTLDTAAGLGLWALGSALCVWQVVRYTPGSGAGDGSGTGDTGVTSSLIINPYALDALLANFAEAMLPLLNFFDAEFWGRNILRLPGAGPPLLLTAVAVLWLIAVTLGLGRRAAACGAFVAGVVAMLLFSLALFRGWFTRHLGHYFILLVAVLWLYHAARPAAVPVLSRLAPDPHNAAFRRRASALFTALLAVHAAVGLAAWGVDLARPFSGAPAAAAAINRQLHKDPNTRLLTNARQATSPVAALLDRPLLDLATDRPMGAIDWALYNTVHEPGSVPDTLARHGWDTPDAPPVVLLTTQLPPRVPGCHWTLLNPHTTPPVLLGDEDYRVWRLERPAPSPLP